MPVFGLELRQLGASQAAAVLRARAADLEREAEEERKNMREVTLAPLLGSEMKQKKAVFGGLFGGLWGGGRVESGVWAG